MKPSTADSRLAGAFITFARVAGVAAFLAGSAVLASWLFGFDAVRSLAPGTENMKANTALCFAASGAALRLAVSVGTRGRRAGVRGLALLILATGTATLAEYAFGLDPGIDQLLAADPGAKPPGRMAPATATAFVLAGAAFLLLDFHVPAAQFATLSTLAAGLLGVLGYLFGAQAIQSVEAYASMAPATAILLVLLSAGLLCARPEAGLMRDLTRPMLGSKAARRLILWSPPVLLPLAWLRLQGETAGYYGTGFGLALMMALAIGTLAGAAWITARSMNRAHQALLDSEARFRGILESAVDAIVIADAAGRIVNLNASTEELFGYASHELLGQSIELLIPERYRAAHRKYRERYDERTLAGPMRDRPLFGLRKDGSEFFAEISLSTLRTAEGVLVTSIVRDITQRKSYEEQLEYQANHDTLTGLANRNLASDRLQQGIQYAHRHQMQMAVLFIDLDHFKVINDSLGHSAGDHLLQTVAERLEACLREGDTVARMGGDEFVMVLQEISRADDVTLVMRRVHEEMLRPVVLDGQSLVVTCSIGASIYPKDGADAETLLKHADSAMYRAKDLGRNRFQFFAAEMNQRANERLSMESKLRRALDNGELLLHYQPQVDLSSGRIVGAEALLRWHHPELGVVPPDRFIPLAEETGLIIPIGEWVLYSACAQNRAWQEAGLAPLRVAVNLSARQFRECDLASLVQRVLAETQLDGTLLDLELTESQAMQELDSVIATLRAFKAMGVSAALDDFGTGYSSLSYLKQFAIDKLKIDRSFVQSIASDPNDATIAATVIAMAHSLNLRVVAEGVETKGQLDYLRSRDCDEMQGFLFSRPLPAENFARLLREDRRLPAPARAGERC